MRALRALLRALLAWPSRGLDRMVTADPLGRPCVCVDPPWWGLRRWLRWLRVPRGLRGAIGVRGQLTRVTYYPPRRRRPARGRVHSG